LFGLLLLAAFVPGCNPLLIAALVYQAANPPKTEHKSVVNETDYFHRSADHHDFHDVETYTWHNCGEQALVDGEVKPSCPNDINITIWDAEGTMVFDQIYHAPHCFKGKKDWDPVASAKGVPGDWTIRFVFDIEGVRDLIFDITRLGDEPVEVVTSDGSPHEGEEDDDHDRDDDGVEDDHQGAYLQWHAHCTNGRTKTESYSLPMACESAILSASWETMTAGTMRVTVTDGAGAVVFDHLLAPGDPTPFASEPATGMKGTWTVTLEAIGLTSDDLRIKIQAATCGCQDE
jgi:hypothetical protein